jgi:hypothetical protein
MIKSGERDEYLQLIVEKVFPMSMDVLADSAPHINDMT